MNARTAEYFRSEFSPSFSYLDKLPYYISICWTKIWEVFIIAVSPSSPTSSYSLSTVYSTSQMDFKSNYVSSTLTICQGILITWLDYYKSFLTGLAVSSLSHAPQYIPHKGDRGGFLRYKSHQFISMIKAVYGCPLHFKYNPNSSLWLVRQIYPLLLPPVMRQPHASLLVFS